MTNAPLHPAKFSPQILEAAVPHLAGYKMVLDPFAGIGRIHQLADVLPIETLGVEIESYWARAHKRTLYGSALNLTDFFDEGSIPAVFTSPTYGNRMADHHTAKDGSIRRSYTHDLRRLTNNPDIELHDDNSGKMHWGSDYRIFHRRVWRLVNRVLEPRGRFILNMKNHPRGGVEQRVSEWHLDWLLNNRFKLVAIEVIGVSGMGYGENQENKNGHEYLFVMDKKG